MVELRFWCVCSLVRLTLLFQELLLNGTWLVALALRTPGMARSEARSACVSEGALSSVPMPVICMRTMSCSSKPLMRCICDMRSPIRNSALQMMAQLSAISRTISAAAVLWRRSVERMGRISMAFSRELPLLRLELHGRRHLAGVPRGHEAGDDAGGDRKDEGGDQHRRVQVREVRVRRGLLAHGPQAEHRQAQAQHAAREADGAGFDQALREDRATRGTQRATHADFRAAAQELGEQQADGVEQAHGQEAEGQPHLQAHVARNDLAIVQPLHDAAQANVGRTLETARRMLLVGIVGEIALVGFRL